MTRNVLTIFLASPGDLQEERRIIKEVVDNLNKSIAKKLDWYIDLLGAEDTRPGMGRPQELIDQDVDECDLFLGMLWKRWGSPTGEYSSGFEEEFTRARSRRLKTKKPEIWLYFKNVDEELLKDPGEQLKRVLEFKSEQERRKELLFKTFKDSNDWQTLIYRHLIEHLLDIARGQEKPTISIPEFSQAIPSDKEIQIVDMKGMYPVQIHELIAKVYSNVMKEGAKTLDVWESLRLLLLTNTWFSEAYPEGELLGVHEVNLIYHKKEWELTNEEKRLIFRTLMNDVHDVRPGWYWIRDWEDKAIDSMLCSKSGWDSKVAVRRKSLLLLASTGYHAPYGFLKSRLMDEDEDIVLQAIELLKIYIEEDALDLLEDLIHGDNPKVQDAALVARVEILYHERPNEAFLELIDMKAKLPSSFQSFLDTMDLKVDTELLIQALDGAEVSTRKFSAQYLRQAKLLSKEICEKLLKDTHADIRKEGLIGLIELDEEVDENLIKQVLPDSSQARNEIEYLLLSKCAPEELMPLIQGFGLDGAMAYRILAINHFEVIKSKIRNDLEQNFESLWQEFQQEITEKIKETETQLTDLVQRKEKSLNQLPKEQIETIDKQLLVLREQVTILQQILTSRMEREKELLEYLKAHYISAALAGLVRNGKPEDVKFARKFLGTTQYNLADKEAIELIAKFGDFSDAEKLLEVANDTYGDIQCLAAESALKVSPGADGILPKMLYHENRTIVTIAIQELLNIPSEKSIELAKPLLLFEKDDIRLKGLAVLTHFCKREDLEKLLEDYINRERYYYNVVTWLDRHLFAPGRYGEFFRNQLHGMLTEKS